MDAIILTPDPNARVIKLSAAILSALALALTNTIGAIHQISDGDSFAYIDADSDAGMYNWTIGSQNHLQKQWFYYRVGGGLAAPINAIGSSTVLYSDANTLQLEYGNSDFTLTVSYLLTAGSFGAGSADILETVSVLNHSGAALDFHLFQYSNFDLLGTPGGDTVEFPASDSVIQTEGVFGIQEGIIQPPASHLEAALVGSTINNLTTIPGYNLNDNGGPLSGDVTWSFQWDYSIANNQSLDVYKDKTLIVPVIPEPSTLSLIAVGLGALAAHRRRK
jgi:hypothetical protein